MYTSGLLFIGTQEIIIIVVLVLLLFGGKKIPELMRGLGRGVKEFKDGQREEPTENQNSTNNNNNPQN
ncbi:MULTISPECIES: twin-arginine translocase TatA/TatE family subunit [Sphingobacterium]|jgi:sec-independent protein translocase protein TatA|uniref:Sec-independent protein translocase protein TatA n=2 Tax=Sphingobacterium TaxID=28453 RepID=A0A2S9J595_9SPHI|nr:MULTISPECIES: twin-arginine translocase TatA/TatE family subunit [Sphingobacterium]MBD1420168.1 twin-arginine translocase TatA/TatE family subunit [Sphingobacterium chuzhouense]NGM64842.1 twin-arginine translocase TatA/TatE family subunit [Sphingobacterium sp. SGR-19]PRD47968.1 twin-arginine translocase TatA/TatE family subunit [Sphingobacterium haloxyli]HLT87823.1 twin-arginine translocase TatA/TatE family subunit [Sphingobacterium sp.]